MELIHGGDVYTYAAQHGGTLPLDLSANINPYGCPQSVRRAMHESVECCDRYPDPLCRHLRRAIGQAEHVPAEWLFCGNGAADVLDRLARVLCPKTTLLTAPTFAEYEQTVRGSALRFHLLRAEENFAVTERILDELIPDLDAVYLCNPNNPTGRTIEPALLQKIVNRCTENHIWLLVDECFHDFLVDASQHTLKSLLAEHPQLILLRAFTKMYAVPGVRLGYCMTANLKLLQQLYRAGQPWNVSVIAQACGVAAADEWAFAQETAQKIAQERAFLQKAMQERGFHVFQSAVNFLLFRTADTALHEKLEAHGVLIRDCSNYRGLEKGYYRIAVRTQPESQILLAKIDEINGDRI